MISFSINLDPMPQPRIKARRMGAHIQVYTPANALVRAYKASIVEAFAQRAGEDFVPFKGPLRLSIRFVFERPAARMSEEAHISKPDIDNLAKAVLDALNKVAWNDDSQISQLYLEKAWADVYLAGKSGRKRFSGPAQICCVLAEL